MLLLYRKACRLSLPVATVAGLVAVGVTAAHAATTGERLAGRFVLQAESRGELWYVHPVSRTKTAVTAANAVTVLSAYALGISNADLDRIPSEGAALPADRDSDGDGYPDALEARTGYRLFGSGKAQYDETLRTRLAGRILLQAEGNGQLWYVHPQTRRALALNAATILQTVAATAIGATDQAVASIPTAATAIATGPVPLPVAAAAPQPQYSGSPAPSSAAAPDETISAAANAIQAGDAGAVQYFTQTVRNAVAYTVDFLDADGRFLLANMLRTARTDGSTTDEVTYVTRVFYNGDYHTVSFTLQRQPDGRWLLANL